MSGYPPHGTGTGGFPVPGGVATDGEDSMAEVGWEMEVQLGGGGKRGGGVRSNGDVHLEKAEYGGAVYCDATNSRPVLGRGEEEGGTIRAAVTGIGRN